MEMQIGYHTATRHLPAGLGAMAYPLSSRRARAYWGSKRPTGVLAMPSGGESYGPKPMDARYGGKAFGAIR